MTRRSGPSRPGGPGGPGRPRGPRGGKAGSTGKGGKGTKGASGGALRARPATERVRTAAGRSNASTRWLARQLNDPYVAEARRLGYRSRAAFKLAQLDDRFALLRPGLAVVDLGAAPGGWTQIAVARIGADRRRGRVVAIDRLAIDPIAGAEVVHLDFLDPTAPERLTALLGRPADLVLSDLSPDTTGHAATDHLRILALAEAAFDFACGVLAPGGGFVCKLFQGGATPDLLAGVRRAFAKVRHAKPPASRAESAETYLVATGFRGRPADEDPPW